MPILGTFVRSLTPPGDETIIM